MHGKIGLWERDVIQQSVCLCVRVVNNDGMITRLKNGLR